MKKTFLLALCALCSMAATADDYSSYYTNLPVNMPATSEPQIANRTVSVADYGAVGDGVTLCTDAFTKAINDVAQQGGGHVVVPAGVWVIAPITLRSGVDLHLEKNAIVMATPDKKLHLAAATDPREVRCPSLINAANCHDIAITGEGIIDGNGAQWRPVKRGKVSDVEWSEFNYRGGTQTNEGQLWFPYNLTHYDNIANRPEREEARRANLVRFVDCENVLLRGVTLQNSPRFHYVPTRCRNVIIDNATVRCPWNAQNGDAIDISNCKDVLIVNSTIDAGDDGICMKGGVGNPQAEPLPCENILIVNNTVYHAHGGFVIGSDFAGGMKNIVVRNNRFCGTDVGLRFKSGIGRGGKTENIFIDNVFMSDIKDQAIIFECTYVDNRYNIKTNDGKLVIPENAPYVPNFSDIHISNVVCHNTKTAIKAHGLPGYRCVYDISIDNCSFFYTKTAVDTDDTAELTITNTKFTTYEK